MASIEECSLATISIESAKTEIDLVALVETYSALLFRIAHSVLRSRPESEDVVQDVFVRVVQHRPLLNDVRDMRAWLIRIAWNLAIDRRRRIQPEQIDQNFAETLATQAVPADEVMEETQRMKSVLFQMDRLPRKERQVLLLAAIEELGTAEIAQVMGRSESAVRALLFRARTRLRERLEQQRGES